MKKTVLLFNFDENRLPLVKRAVMPLKTGIKVVDKKDFNQVLGYLAEIPGFQVIEGEADETFDVYQFIKEKGLLIIDNDETKT